MRQTNPRPAFDPAVARIVDVNINRLTEALKVIEDILRLGKEKRSLLRQVRSLRTELGKKLKDLRRQVINFRASKNDPGRAERFDRLPRRCIDDVLLANFKRAEESARVLEEMLKIIAPELAPRLKATRFRLYELEQAALAKSP